MFWIDLREREKRERRGHYASILPDATYSSVQHYFRVWLKEQPTVSSALALVYLIPYTRRENPHCGHHRSGAKRHNRVHLLSRNLKERDPAAHIILLRRKWGLASFSEEESRMLQYCIPPQCVAWAWSGGRERRHYPLVGRVESQPPAKVLHWRWDFNFIWKP